MKIICIGRNYAEHAKELNNAVSASPVVFLKPKSSLLQGTTFYYPEFTKDLHYECEVVVKICKNGKHIKEKFAKNYYQQITVGIDFTARDLQQQQKEKGLPWEIAKAFDGSAVVGKFIDIPADVQAINFSLHKNNLLV
jgi:2-keto-4-pentenoate hydratase/2-oxohepta-3-ene-1,7-dioic acid hydratase in catechol pathway